jgi:hypothetical protein
MNAFYDLSETQRSALTERALAERRTLSERWTALGKPETDNWDGRASLAAEWLATETSVLDLGCGTMNLERYLPGSRYYPSDVVARDDRTIVADYNVQSPPKTDARAVACLGLLEYLYDPLSFMHALSAQYPLCVVSYCMTDAPKPLEPRRSHGWVNDFDRPGIETIFEMAEWDVDAFRMVDDIQGLWRLRRTTG